MATDTQQVGAAWMQIVKKNGTPEFAESFTPDAALQTSVLSKAMVGPTLIGAFFSATSKMYEHIEFTAETIDRLKTYLEWKAVYGGNPVDGVTTLTRDESGRISNIKLFHSPLPIVRAFSSGLEVRLGSTLDADFFS